MRTTVGTVVLLAVAAGLAAAGAQAAGTGPAALQRAGWSCLNPESAFPANPDVHCFPPGQLEGVIAGTAESAMLEAFATADVNAEEAPFLGTERMIRADLFNPKAPCPTDPAGGPPGAAASPPLYEWSYLGPRFGWDYYICHTFDSPW